MFVAGLTGPSSLAFSPSSRDYGFAKTYLAFLSSSTNSSNSSTIPTTSNNRRHRSGAGGGVGERQLFVLDTTNFGRAEPLLRMSTMPPRDGDDSPEEKLRRERQRTHSSSTTVTQFSWVMTASGSVRLLVPLRGSLYVQNGITGDDQLQMVYDKSSLQSQLPTAPGGSVLGKDAGAIDAQLSPDGTMVAFVVAGEIYVVPAHSSRRRTPSGAVRAATPVRITFGARQDGNACISHGLADFVAQEEMERFHGFWWEPSSKGIILARLDESSVPPFRITHQGRDTGEEWYEDHRYPFAGQANPKVQLGYVEIDRDAIVRSEDSFSMQMDADELAKERWAKAIWFQPPREAGEYLARVSWFPDGSACSQWQNRTQSTLVVVRMDLASGKTRTLLVERSDVFINLHHMMRVLPRAVHPDECADVVERNIVPSGTLPQGSFSFIFASERTGFFHLYLYTYVPGINSERAVLVRAISNGEWMVEGIVGVDMDKDAVYFTGTYDSCLEKHLYALPIVGTSVYADEGVGGPEHSNFQQGGGMRRSIKNVMNALSGSKSARMRDQVDGNLMPARLTLECGMHSVVMDDDCRMFVDTSSDLGRPTSVKVYKLPDSGPFSISAPNLVGRKSSRRQFEEMDARSDDVRLLFTLFSAASEDKPRATIIENQGNEVDRLMNLPAPELLSFPTKDGTETLHAALYLPDQRMHGLGPYPLVCSVYGGPHVQRVNRSWSLCCDMRAQRLRSLGFAVVKCDNRGSSRRGLGFEGSIRRRLGRLEVLDQVAAVEHLIVRGIADPKRVGIYGWSYGGYLAAMCLCRAPDIFHVAIAGAPVTSWDGYDTHYTERYMGLPGDNPNGYRESAVFDHVPNMKGKLMLVHGLIDENVHFRHTVRLIDRLIAAGKDYDLLIFPDERHSPRRLRDRIYMEQRINDYFSRHLSPAHINGHQSSISANQQQVMRPLAGNL